MRVVTGELAGVASATQLPDVPCRKVRFRANSANTGKVCIGVSGVTLQAGTTTTTAGFSLSASGDSDWIPVSNLNQLYRICTGTGDACTYIAVK